jgi:NAD-dependent dihydropyrimidine dehydrogenase PreA subunit
MRLVNDAITINHETCTDCGICIKVCPMKSPYEVKQ